MRYNPKARLDRSQVRVRGRGGGRSSGGGFGGGGLGGGGLGGSRLPIPVGGGGRMGCGGFALLAVVVVILFATGGLGGLLGGGGGGATAGPFGGYSAPATLDDAGVTGLEQCRSGADANSDRACGRLADVNNIQAFWSQALPDQAGVDYELAPTNFFDGSVDTGCGPATSDTGPFYCPADANVYLDVTFFDAMLEGQLGAEGGPFSEAYVLAHEYGHHVQNLLGTMGRVRTQQGENSDAVRLELQADCYAGMWAKFATEVEDQDGEVFILDLTQEDIDRALDAAAAVGDDRIQQRAGRVNPETWTHGSSQARQYWFMVGYDQGTVEACDTFAASDLDG